MKKTFISFFLYRNYLIYKDSKTRKLSLSTMIDVEPKTFSFHIVFPEEAWNKQPVAIGMEALNF